MVPVDVAELHPELTDDVVFGESVEVEHLHHRCRVQQGGLGYLGTDRSDYQEEEEEEAPVCVKASVHVNRIPYSRSAAATNDFVFDFREVIIMKYM